MSQDISCFASSNDPLPGAIWVPSSSLRIYRGTPVDIIQEMTVELGDKPVREQKPEYHRCGPPRSIGRRHQHRTPAAYCKKTGRRW